MLIVTFPGVWDKIRFRSCHGRRKLERYVIHRLLPLYSDLLFYARYSLFTVYVYTTNMGL